MRGSAPSCLDGDGHGLRLTVGLSPIIESVSVFLWTPPWASRETKKGPCPLDFRKYVNKISYISSKNALIFQNQSCRRLWTVPNLL